MTRGHRTVWALLLALSFGLLPTDPATAAATISPTIEAEPCGFRNPIAGRELRCARLTVPARRDRPNWQSYHLPLAIFAAGSPKADAPPVIFLNGGPGIASLGKDGHAELLWGERLPTLDWLEGRDLIVFDPRGVGGAEPAVSCRTQLSRLHLDDEKSDLAKALQGCWNALRRDGLALDSFNSREAAADVIDLAKALDLREWDLWGLSYGTRVALLVQAAAPKGLRAAVLMGAYPPGVDGPVSTGSAFQNALERVFQACAAEAACAKAHPRLRQDLETALAAQRRQPLTLTAALTRGLGPYPHSIDDRLFLSLLHESLYTTAGVTELPLLLSAFAQGRTASLETPVDRLDQATFGPQAGLAARVLYHCNDLPPWNPAERAEAQRRFPLLADWIDAEDLTDFCQSGSLGNPAVQLPADIPASTTPTLVLGGLFDPATPPDWARLTAAAHDRARLYLLRASSHDVHLNACAGQIARQFLNAPEGSIDSDCLDAERLPPFRQD